MSEIYEKVIANMEGKLNRYRMLASVTKHSKKLNNHKQNIKFMQLAIQEAKEEYGIN